MPTTGTHGIIIPDPSTSGAIINHVRDLAIQVEAGLADVEAAAVGVVGVPIFGSQSEALAYEAANPGKVALWIDSGTTPPDPDPDPVPTLGVETFEASTVGQPPAGWSMPWSADNASALTVVEDATAVGGKKARLTGATATTRRAWAWDGAGVDIGSDADVEMLLKCAQSSGGNLTVRPTLHISGSGGTENSINLSAGSPSSMTAGGINAGTIIPGGFGTIAAVVPGTAWRMLRIRIEGTTLSVKSWAHGTTEPASWDGTATIPAGAHTAPGLVGLSLHAAQPAGHWFDIDWTSVAVGGATAPDAEA